MPVSRLILPAVLFFPGILRTCNAQIEIPGFANNIDAVYRREVSVDGAVVGTFEMLHGEEPADAVFRFGQHHGLDPKVRNSFLDDLCLQWTCKRKHAIILKLPVIGKEGELIGVFELPESSEPADAAQEFAATHGLGTSYRDEIIQKSCNVVNCTRFYPLVWKKTIMIDNSEPITIEVEEGQEPADAIFHSLKSFNLPYSQRRRIMEEAKKDSVPFSRDYALAFTYNVVLENQTSFTFDLFDNEIEPTDALYKFSKENNMDEHWTQLVTGILPLACEQIFCSRKIPIIWSKPIKSTDGTTLAMATIYKDQEPVDAIDAFCQSNSLSMQYREHLLSAACEELNCTRLIPVVYRKQINGENGEELGAVEVFDGEEVIDAVTRFIRSGNLLALGMDEIQLKNYFFREACNHRRVKCTRNVAIVYDNRIADENGTDIGRLVLNEFEEPADSIFAWCQEHALPHHVFSHLVDNVCNHRTVICNRKLPLIFGPQKITGPDGEIVGILEIELFQEPVDALYGFFAKYKLFEKDWNILAVLDQICAIPTLYGKCQRRKAIKYFNESFEMGGLQTAPLVIWEEEEVIDKLYDLRITHGLSLEAQMVRFQEICSSEKVHCSRSRAVTYRRSGINLKDYEIFGNETCVRQYAGWKYLSAFTSTKVGSKLSEYIREENVENVIKHPVTCPLLFWVSSFFVLIPYFVFQRPSKKSLFQRVLGLGYVFLIVACIQVLVTEPFDHIDSAYYIYDGALPDLIILEGEEPVDSIMEWAKLVAKEHHPIVRQPIHISLIEETCSRIPCKRRRAWEPLDTGAFHYLGQEYKLKYMHPSHLDASKVNSTIEAFTTELCGRLFPPFDQCISTLNNHIASELALFNEHRLDSKNVYTKLGVEMDATARELFERHAMKARQFGFNISPYARVDNGTATYPSWDIHTTSAYCVKDAFYKVRDPENRLWNDKPCKPLFNGALCAKTDKDGNMIIEA